MKVWDVLNFLHHEGLGQDVLGFFEVMMQPLMERIMAESIHISHYGWKACAVDAVNFC